MVVNRKKLRNRIFKISFSFVIAVLALVLGLSVRSNAKAATYQYDIKSSPYNNYTLSFNTQWGKYSTNVPYYPDSYSGNGLISSYFKSNNQIRRLPNLMVYKVNNTFSMCYVYSLFYDDALECYILPNLIRFNFGNLNIDNVGDGTCDVFINSYISNEYPQLAYTYNDILRSSSSFDALHNSVALSYYSSTSFATTNIGLAFDFNNTQFFNSSYNYIPSDMFHFQASETNYYLRNNIVKHETNVNVTTALNDDNLLYFFGRKNINEPDPDSWGGGALYGMIMFTILLNDSGSISSTNRNYSFNSMPYVSCDYYPLLEVATQYDNYQTGYNDGIASVNTDSYYNNGYDNGYIAGQRSVDVNAIAQNNYTDGYNAGLAVSSADYGIKDLLYSIFDVPINVLSNLFSFTIFGANVWTIIISLLVVLVVLWIVSRVMGIVFAGGGKK